MTIWFTSDTHFGHTKILEHCARPFADVAAMDEALISNWNARVQDDDEIYHLGDFTLKGKGAAERVFARLRGRIMVLGLPWHHDNGWLPKQLGDSRYHSASGHVVHILPALLALRLRDADGTRHTITLSHYPLAEWEAGHHGAWHLHGHSHGNHEGPGCKLDVGVDCFEFAPVSLETLARVMPPHVRPDEARPNL